MNGNPMRAQPPRRSRPVIVGRKVETERLASNLRRGIHTLVFGAPGTGKSAVLQECADRLNASSEPVPLYVRESATRTRLLMAACAELAVRDGRSVPSESRGRPYLRDLRNFLIASGKRQRVCLLLDHLPRLRHGLRHLLEILEQHFTLACAVTAVQHAYDLYYWGFDKIEVRDLPRDIAHTWVNQELEQIGYAEPLRNRLAREVTRLSAGNPGKIVETISAIRRQTLPLNDPIQVRRMFIDGLILCYRADDEDCPMRRTTG